MPAKRDRHKRFWEEVIKGMDNDEQERERKQRIFLRQKLLGMAEKKHISLKCALGALFLVTNNIHSETYLWGNQSSEYEATTDGHLVPLKMIVYREMAKQDMKWNADENEWEHEHANNG